jgi:hypothetical protein
VLIIVIIMFARKKTKIRIAYGMLTFSALAVIALDARVRTTPPIPSTGEQRITSNEPPLPFTITRLADSPFPEACPDRNGPNGTTLAHDESTQLPKRKKNVTSAGVYFLTVAVQVDLGAGPVAFHRGTRVQLLRSQDGKLLVRHNGADFLIEKSQVTDDPDALASLARHSS